MFALEAILKVRIKRAFYPPGGTSNQPDILAVEARAKKPSEGTDRVGEALWAGPPQPGCSDAEQGQVGRKSAASRRAP